MSLEGITICGADDSVGAHMLPLLSKAYPFIEWGILMSRKRVGTPRYPSLAWVDRVCHYYEKHNGFGLAMHLCGEFATVTALGDPAYLVANRYQSFRRVQLNETRELGPSFVMMTKRFQNLEFILQAPTVELVECAAGISQYSKPGRIAALYDPSGGRGLFPGVFPKTPRGLHVGFAGGIGPDNVIDIIERIGARPDPYWLCMESGVRTGDDFDIQKVEAVARKVAVHLAERLRAGCKQVTA